MNVSLKATADAAFLVQSWVTEVIITYSIPIPLKLYNTAIASTKLAVLVLYYQIWE
jgi:hypothetical protein